MVTVARGNAAGATLGGGAVRSEQTGPAPSGRADDLAAVHGFLDDAAADGGTLLLVGEAGSGKTFLLDAVAEDAECRGAGVLRAAGADFEADAAFATLCQLLVDLTDQFDVLSDVHRRAVRFACGFGAQAEPDRLVLCTAVLVLLRHAAQTRPLVLVVDNLAAADRASVEVLGFVGRRLAGSHTALLLATRTDAAGHFTYPGLRVHELGPLDDLSAAGLLDEHYPDLPPAVRRQVLTHAQGNPLSVIELAKALGQDGVGVRRGWQRLMGNGRLRALFESQIADLPAGTRRILLLAVLEGNGDLRALAPALGGRGGLADLAPAEDARLVLVDPVSRRLVFRHPLARAAIIQLSTASERRSAHRALGAAQDCPDRRAWYLAESAMAPDEAVASQLEGYTSRALARGDAVGAVAALARSADLTPEPRTRARRLAAAAYLASHVTGELDTAARQLAEARRYDPQVQDESLHAVVAAAYVLFYTGGDPDTPHRLLVTALTKHPEPWRPDDAELVEAMLGLLHICVAGATPEMWEPYYALLARFGPAPPPRLHLVTAMAADPVRTAGAAVGDLTEAVRSLQRETDPSQVLAVAVAAFFADRLEDCREPVLRIVRDGQRGGAAGAAIKVLTCLCLDGFLTGRWDEACAMAADGIELIRTHRYAMAEWYFLVGQALVAAARGDERTVRMLTDTVDRWAVPRRNLAAERLTCYARSLAALGQGDYETAYRHASAISPAGELASHVGQALWVCLDLVEAAVRTNRATQAAVHAAALRDAGISEISPRLALLAAAAQALTAPDDEAGDRFEEALAVPGTHRWPFDLARVHLLYGEWLRRSRAKWPAREHLTAALQTFEHLQARPWAARAAAELEATSLSTRRSQLPSGAPLTPQEREITNLAAAGLTNKQVGERLRLSHRTVATHLHNAFRKLDVVSRAGLRDALAAMDEGWMGGRTDP
jgi:DNA-binding CsgD family transcriptional regulator